VTRAAVIVGLAICLLAGAGSAFSAGSATTAKIRYLGGPSGQVEFTVRGLPECPEFTSGGRLVMIQLRSGSRVVGRTTWEACKTSLGAAGFAYPDWNDLDRPGQWVSVGGENATYLYPDMSKSGRYRYRYVVTIGGRRALAGNLVVRTTAERIYKGTDAFQNYCKNERQTIYSFKGRLYCWRITYRTVPA
jgi:hypothetical protein